jgi:hypothetical protein
MINLSEIVREECSLGMFGSLKSNLHSDFYLVEDVGDFLANKDRIYIPPHKVFPIHDGGSYNVIFHNVCVERATKKDGSISDGWWNVHDETGQFYALWHSGECGEYYGSAGNYNLINEEQGFESGDWVHSLIIKQYKNISFQVITDVEKSRRPRLPKKDSVKDRIREEFDKIILGDPVPEPN